jgi:hypothetical protein
MVDTCMQEAALKKGKGGNLTVLIIAFDNLETFYLKDR